MNNNEYIQNLTKIITEEVMKGYDQGYQNALWHVEQAVRNLPTLQNVIDDDERLIYLDDVLDIIAGNSNE